MAVLSYRLGTPAEGLGIPSPKICAYQAADVLLAVEVVSPDSGARDRETEPHKYAGAGIPSFWLAPPHRTGTL